MCYRKIYHTTDKRNSRYGQRHGKAEKREEKQHVVTVIIPITFDSESPSCPVKREKANQYCHSQLQIKLSLLLLPLCSFLGHSICRNSDKHISIDCWWDQRINKWNAFFFLFLPSLCFFLQNGQGVKQWSKTHKKTAVINKHNKTLI